MFKVFPAYLKEKKVDLTGEELNQIRAVIVSKKLRNHQYLLQKVNINHHTCFIVTGRLRNYRVSEDGAEHILRFAIENWCMVDLERRRCYLN